MKNVLLTLFLFSIMSSASAQTCVGPAPCDVTPQPPTLCIGSIGCNPVRYYEIEGFSIAISELPGSASNVGPCFSPSIGNCGPGYKVIGVAGPCKYGSDFSRCPNISIQAFNQLLTRALEANRPITFVRENP
jgi:hypothetical protein